MTSGGILFRVMSSEDWHGSETRASGEGSLSLSLLCPPKLGTVPENRASEGEA